MGLTRVCGLLAFSSLMAAEAQTPPTTTQASTASANFAYVSDDGCVQNEVMVFVNRTMVVSAKAPSTTAEVTYSRYRYDYCEDSDLGTDLGTNSRPVFSGDLNRASLNATINGHTDSGSVVTISLVLVWEGKGSITRRASRPQNTRAGSATLIRSENLSRNAVVSGTLDDRDISDAIIGASLHTTRKTISR
jgi:hypothetical protein